MAAESVKIRILQTTDVHSFIEHSDNPQEGGWLRLATMIKQHRQKEDCLLIDCGDTIQGSLSAIASRGEAAVEMLNYLKYDFWVPGNHELDFGIPRYVELLDKDTILSAKLLGSSGGIKCPVSPSTIVSGVPPILVPITGFFIAMAAMTTVALGSGSFDGSRNISVAAKHSGKLS